MQILITISLALILSLTPPAHSQDLKNDNFFEASISPEIPDDWMIWGDWIRREPSWHPQPPSGTALGYHHYQIKGPAPSGFYQDVPDIKAGQKVRFSILVMIDSHSEGTFRPHSIELILESGEDGQTTPFQTTEILLEDFPTDEKWQEITVEGTVPQDGLRVMVSVTPSESEPRSSSIKFGEAFLQILK